MRKAVLMAVVLSASLTGAAGQPTAGGLERPVCGDDQREFLTEELGETDNPYLKDGKYGCTSNKDTCLYRDGKDGKFLQPLEYQQANEQGENEARFKDDREVCFRKSDDPYGAFYDQDYGDLDGDGIQESCDVNALYGGPGVRWFQTDYIRKYPYAVIGGIDDDLNPYLQSKGVSKRDHNASAKDFETSPAGKSPVESGTDFEEVVTLGFCGGDDGSEYLSTQVCRTDVCRTNRSHFGVAKTPGSCVYDGRDIYPDVPQPVDSDKHKRMLYGSGESITLDYRQEQTITCVGGTWYEEGPILFERENVTVPFGSTVSAGFSVVNLGELPTEYRVELGQQTQAERFSRFATKKGTSFTVEVDPKESKEFNLRIRGQRKNMDSTVELTARGTSSSRRGSDELDVEVVDTNASASNITSFQEQERNIPGITGIEILVLLMSGLGAFVLLQ